MVYDYVERIDEVLDKLESEAVPYNYETYESHCPQNENNVKVSNDYLSVYPLSNRILISFLFLNLTQKLI